MTLEQNAFCRKQCNFAVEIEETSLNETRVVGEIVNMSADESILDEEGNIDLGKLQPVIFNSAKNEYRVVGEKVGTAWGSGKALVEREVSIFPLYAIHVLIKSSER